MLALTLRTLRARPLRLVLSGIAVMLGVAFLSGVMVFSHGLAATFHQIVDGSTPDAVVRAGTAQGLGETAVPTSALDEALVRRLAALPQVARADGEIQALGMSVLRRDGRALGGAGGPTVALTHDSAPNMDGGRTLDLTSGRWPTLPSEIALDSSAARDAGYRLGEEVSVLAPTGRPVRLRLVGTADFTGGGTVSATLIVLSQSGAQHLLMHDRPVFTRIALTAAPGTSQQQLAAAAQMLLPAGFQAVTGDKVAQQSQDAIGGFLDAISTFLLIFAIIAVVVSAFIIVNTFTVVVAQRTQELALLRALGASRLQVRRTVLGEAVVVGALAATVGIGLGWLLARALAAGFGTFGLTLGTSTLVLSPGVVVAGYLVGVGVTALAAYLPARRTGRIPPVAALRSAQVAPTRPTLLRTGLGMLGALVGAGCAYLGVADIHPQPGAPALWVGLAGVIWIVCAAALMPSLGRPLLWLCRSAYGRLFGVSGRLAGDNALRDPRRTGATASALMIGLALVSTIAVLSSSLGATIDDTVHDRFPADFMVQGADHRPFPTAVGDRVARVRGVGTVSREQDLPAMLDGGWVALAGVDPSYLATHGLTVASGSGTLRPGSALVSRSYADDHDVRVGQRAVIAVAGKSLHARIGGIFDGGHDVAEVLVPLRSLAAAGIPRQDNALSIMLVRGADRASARAALERALRATPYVELDDRKDFSDQLHRTVDKMIYLIYGLLALAVIIAVLGIVNTLSLSVFERTRELGLLRAVGMMRSQVRRMVTLESVAIALLGALVGLGLGVLVGVLLCRALASSLSSLAVPVGWLVGFVAVSVVIGVLAAIGPSIRAARMSPLEAAQE